MEFLQAIKKKQKGKIDMSKVSDEALVAALISCGTMKAAAASVGLTERAVFDRMKDRDFKAIYQQAKTDVIREAVFKMNAQVGAALDCVLEIMENKNIKPEVRLQAADKVFVYAEKFSKRLSMDEHTAELASSDFHIDL